MATSIQQCNLPFNEKVLFNSPNKYEIKEQVRKYFYNISRIVDCVGCEHCRLHFRLQIVGLGTALKILFDDTNYWFTRNELVGLINTLAKFSQSIFIIEHAQELERAEEGDEDQTISTYT